MGVAAGLLESDDGGVVYVWGNAAFGWDAGDEAARRFAAVQLVRTKTANPSQVAQAFGVGTTTLWRWQCDFANEGVAGLLNTKRGPKGQRVLSEEDVERVKALRAQGKSLREIASVLGCSTSPVRQALGLLGRGEPDRAVDDEVDDDEVDDDAIDAITIDEIAEEVDEVIDDEARAEEASVDRPVPSLEPLSRPEPRIGERALARFGLLDEAPPVFTEGAGLPRLGTMLVLPALEATGLIEAATSVFRKMRNGFYGLTAIILTMVFLATLREPRAEGATRLPPVDLGRLLGLDRAPEVKTIRRKLAELAQRGLGSKLVSVLATRHTKARPEALGYLYLDGHVRVYAGKRDLQKAHVTRARIAAPATLETWASDERGDPVFVVTSVLSASLVTEIRRLLPEIRQLVGERRVTVVFDRGGWSPELFAQMTAAGFDFLTYRKGRVAKEPVRAFSEQTYIEEGVSHTYDLAERNVRLRLPKKVEGRKTLLIRQVTRRQPGGHQTPIVTSRRDVSSAEVAHKMFARWRQENYFRYAREHFALDALDSYAAAPDDPQRTVPNPQRKVVQARLRKARAELSEAEAAIGAAAADNAESQRKTMRGFKIANASLTTAIRQARADVERLEAEVADTPTRMPLQNVRPEATVLDEERKLVTHAIRMSTYNAESALARMLAPHFPIDEARSLLREAFNTPGDLRVRDRVLEVRLDPLSAPRRSRALAALCTELTAAESTYPGTDLVLRYAVKDHPGVA
jgi:DNA-binding transcriptional MerR regulator